MGEKVKQIIIWRNDLKVRKGKFGAQVAHASLALLLNNMGKEGASYRRGAFRYNMVMEIEKDGPWDKWINGRFTKIVASCENEAELLQLYGQAKAAGIPCVLITDAGLTEFKGVPTNTCIGIGPYWSEEIDKITGHLKLL